MLKGSGETASTFHAPEHPEFTYSVSTWKRKIQPSPGELSYMVNCVLCHTTSEYDPTEHGLKGTDCSALCRIWSIFKKAYNPSFDHFFSLPTGPSSSLSSFFLFPCIPTWIEASFTIAETHRQLKNWHWKGTDVWVDSHHRSPGIFSWTNIVRNAQCLIIYSFWVNFNNLKLVKTPFLRQYPMRQGIRRQDIIHFSFVFSQLCLEIKTGMYFQAWIWLEVLETVPEVSFLQCWTDLENLYQKPSYPC